MLKAGFPWRTKHFITRQNKGTVKVNKLNFETQHAFGCFQIFIIHVNHSVVRSGNKKNGCVKNTKLASFEFFSTMPQFRKQDEYL